MLTDSQIASLFLGTPTPAAPPDLLSDLKRQIALPPLKTHAMNRPAGLMPRWSRILLAGLGTAAIAIALSTGILNLGGGRSFAAAAESLRQVRSMRVVQFERQGPSQAVVRDPKRPANAWPNFSTTLHASNPLVQTEIRYRLNANGQAERVTFSERDTVWNHRNWELRVNRDTGEREFRLNAMPQDLESIVAPTLEALSETFRPIASGGATATGATDPLLSGCWVGERQLRGMPSGGHTPHWVNRIWFHEATQLARRVEMTSDDYVPDGKPWVFHALEFHEVDQPMADHWFQFEITDADLLPLGLTRAGLEHLSPRAFSAEVSGEAGKAISVVLVDANGRRRLEGTLPFRFVHDPNETTKIDVRFKDNLAHPIGLKLNNAGIDTVGTGLHAEVPPSGAIRMNSVN